MHVQSAHAFAGGTAYLHSGAAQAVPMQLRNDGGIGVPRMDGGGGIGGIRNDAGGITGPRLDGGVTGVPRRDGGLR